MSLASIQLFGTRFRRVPKAVGPRTAIHATSTCLFWKPGLFRCCKGNKKKLEIIAKLCASRGLYFQDIGILAPEIRSGHSTTSKSRNISGDEEDFLAQTQYAYTANEIVEEATMIVITNHSFYHQFHCWSTSDISILCVIAQWNSANQIII